MNLCKTCLYGCGDVWSAEICDKYIESEYKEIYVSKREDIIENHGTKELKKFLADISMNKSIYNIHSNKLTLFEWYATEGEFNSPEEAQEALNESLNSGKAIHCGDCTSDSCPCELCHLESVLSEYRKYYLKKS